MMTSSNTSHSTYPSLLSFVLPVYNETKNIRPLYQKISETMQHQPHDYELIFVDDGSSDGSFEGLHKIHHKDQKVKVIRFRKNFGKAAAYSAGFRKARGDIIITMDTDLQDDPGDIPLFLESIGQGYDMVIGWRHRRSDPINKTLPSKIFNKFVSMATKIPLHDFNCPFKAYRKEILSEIDIYGDLHRLIPVLASSKGFSLKEVRIRNLPRRHGKSKYGTERYLRGMLDLLTTIFITRFAKRPLHFLGLGGIIVCAFGLGILLFFTMAHFLYLSGLLVEIKWKIHERPFLSLGILLMIVGTQFFSIGLLGELFIARSGFRDGSDRYSIRETLE